MKTTILACLWLILMGACSSTPSIPPVVDPAGTALNYSTAAWQDDRNGYDRLMAAYGDTANAQKLEAASLWRDRMVNRVRADIRSFHAEYEVELTKGIANWNIFGDLTQLGLALASTVTKGQETKTILSAAIAATAGAKLSVDNNYFREKTSEVLISSMRSARVEKDTAIVGKLASMKADKYPLEEALCDLVDLYYAGTLTEAFQRLAKQAGNDAEQVETKAAELDSRRAYLLATTEEQIDKRRTVTAAILKLEGAELDAMLTAMKVTAPADAKPAEKRTALIGKLKAETQGVDVTDPAWARWEEALAKAKAGK